MAMLGDGMQSYNNDKDGSDNELAGCEVIYRLSQRKRKIDIHHI
jgi:hypothetical protein